MKERSAKDQLWIFSIRYWNGMSNVRKAVIGRGCASTVEAALHLAEVPEELRAEIRRNSEP